MIEQRHWEIHGAPAGTRKRRCDEFISGGKKKAASSPEEVRPGGVQEMAEITTWIELLRREGPESSTIDVLVCNTDLPQKPIQVGNL